MSLRLFASATAVALLCASAVHADRGGSSSRAKSRSTTSRVAHAKGFFDKKHEAKRGKVVTLYVSAPSPERARAPKAAPQPRRDERQHRRPAPVEPTLTCMAPSDQAAVQNEISNAAFSSDKLRILEDAMRYRTLCGEQVVEILALIPFSSDKLQALRSMAPRIADPENNFRIYGAFSFERDKEQARQLLN